MLYLLVAIILTSVPQDATSITVTHNGEIYFTAVYEGPDSVIVVMPDEPNRTASRNGNVITFRGKEVDVISRLDIEAIDSLDDLPEIESMDRGEYSWKITQKDTSVSWSLHKDGAVVQIYMVSWVNGTE